MPNPRLPIILFVLLAAGCAAPPSNPAAAAKPKEDRRAKFDRELSAWHGRTIKELIADRGEPTSSYRMSNGNWVYTYTDDLVAPPSMFGRAVIVYPCTVNYVTDKASVIVSHSFTGC